MYCFICSLAKRFLTACLQEFLFHVDSASSACWHSQPWAPVGRTEPHGQSPWFLLHQLSFLGPTPFPSFPQRDPSPSSPGARPLSHPPLRDRASHFPRQIQATFQRPRQDVPRRLSGLIPKEPILLQDRGATQKN